MQGSKLCANTCANFAREFANVFGEGHHFAYFLNNLNLNNDVSESIKERRLQRLKYLIKVFWLFCCKAFLGSYQRDCRLMSALENLLFRQKDPWGEKVLKMLQVLKKKPLHWYHENNFGVFPDIPCDVHVKLVKGWKIIDSNEAMIDMALKMACD